MTPSCLLRIPTRSGLRSCGGCRSRRREPRRASVSATRLASRSRRGAGVRRVRRRHTLPAHQTGSPHPGLGGHQRDPQRSSGTTGFVAEQCHDATGTDSRLGNNLESLVRAPCCCRFDREPAVRTKPRDHEESAAFASIGHLSVGVLVAAFVQVAAFSESGYVLQDVPLLCSASGYVLEASLGLRVTCLMRFSGVSCRT